jgi:hypothetical protein
MSVYGGEFLELADEVAPAHRGALGQCRNTEIAVEIVETPELDFLNDRHGRELRGKLGRKLRLAAAALDQYVRTASDQRCGTPEGAN